MAGLQHVCNSGIHHQPKCHTSVRWHAQYLIAFIIGMSAERGRPGKASPGFTHTGLANQRTCLRPYAVPSSAEGALDITPSVAHYFGTALHALNYS